MKVLVAFAALLTVSTPAIADKAPPPPEPSTHPDWAKVRDQGLSGLTASLFDPGSAVINWTSGFAWGFTKPIIGRRSYAWVACGTINAKNRMGGYVGAEPFWIAADAHGAASWGMVSASRSSCDGGTGVPINPELKNISPNMPVASGGPPSVADELEKLASLRDKGIITQAEFDDQKARLLAR